MAKKWDGEAFRSRMRAEARNKQIDYDTQNGRIRRGQSHGTVSRRDEALGEAVICDTLSTISDSDSPLTLLAFLDEREKYIEEEIGEFSVEDRSAFLRGYRARINQVRGELQAYLSD